MRWFWGKSGSTASPRSPVSPETHTRLLGKATVWRRPWATIDRRARSRSLTRRRPWPSGCTSHGWSSPPTTVVTRNAGKPAPGALPAFSGESSPWAQPVSAAVTVSERAARGRRRMLHGTPRRTGGGALRVPADRRAEDLGQVHVEPPALSYRGAPRSDGPGGEWQ